MIRTRYLTAYVLASDAVLLFGALPLERYALRAAFSPSTSVPVIAALLALNVLLLAIVVTAALASCGLLTRVVRAVRHRHREAPQGRIQ